MEGAKVLIIDDEVEFSTTLAERLEMRDYQAFAATCFKDILTLVKDNRPDVVLLDLKMPGIDGMQVLKNIKEIDPGIAIIVITGQTDPGLVSDVLRAGAYDCLTKPADITHLIEKIDEVTSGSKESVQEE